MATIVDHQIRRLCREQGLVEPFNPDLVNPASIDVTLGTKILVESEPIYRLARWSDPGEVHEVVSYNSKIVKESPADRWTEVDISHEPYYMSPGEFVLAHTAELIRVPNDLECVFNLKSSRGREGYDHLLAGYIDPGFVGRVTLELVNVNRHQKLVLQRGMKIGQLRFSRLDATPMRSYAVTGRYQGDQSVQESKG